MKGCRWFGLFIVAVASVAVGKTAWAQAAEAETAASPRLQLNTHADSIIGGDSSVTRLAPLGPVAVKRPEAAAPDLANWMAPSRSESRAMIVVGLAGLVIGSVIDDSPGQLVMVGGAVLFLAGLYHYLK